MAVVLVAVAGCSGPTASGPQTSETPDSGAFTHVGTVREIENLVPVDGGVVITLDLDTGGTRALAVSQLGRWAPLAPLTEERRALVDTLFRLRVGHRVRAEGKSGGEYPGITRLTILPRAHVSEPAD
jgi:hypothetical protein